MLPQVPFWQNYPSSFFYSAYIACWYTMAWIVSLWVISFPTLPGVMTRTIHCFIVAFVLSLSGWNAHAQAKERVDLLLALAADVSRSIDADKFKLQREGYAAAFGDARVVNAIASGLRGRIAVCFIEWSDSGSQRLVIDWTPIENLGTAKQFGDQLLELPRSFA